MGVGRFPISEVPLYGRTSGRSQAPARDWNDPKGGGGSYERGTPVTEGVSAETERKSESERVTFMNTDTSAMMSL